MLVNHNVFVPSKAEYVKGRRPQVDCILCAVRDGHPDVDRLIIAAYERFLICCNLYPFNAGHIMIFPREHRTELEQLDADDALELHRLTLKSLGILRREYECGGFNVGYNLGGPSGGSIPHLHLHIIPRYDREIGLLDIIGGAKIIIEDPRITLEKLRKAFAET